MLFIFFSVAVITWLYFTVVFFIAYLKNNYSLVDTAWGPGFILIALYSFLNYSSFYPRQILITVLTILWGTRLGVHILLRSLNKKEDPRYSAFRKSWGNLFLTRMYFQMYLVQALSMLIIAYPIILINSYSNADKSLLDYLGLLLWSIGFFFEAVGDYQLKKFIENPENKGRIMQYGLWRYTRHPNYFGELSIWWAIYLIALNVPYGWTAIISPLLISYLLLYVSGIPILEKQFAGNSEFEKYKEKTSALFPWFKEKRQ